MEQWTFHLSVVYAQTLAPDAWAALADACRRDLPDLPAETIGEAEFVWYEGGVEHAEVIRLGVGG